MAQCVAVDSVGALVVDASTPCLGLVVLTPAEYSSLLQNPFLISVSDGLLISGAVIAVWVAAWCIKAVASVLRSDGEALED